MKNTRTLILSFLALAASALALAAKPLAGPKGGRILTADAPHAEFFVEKDRTVTVTFYDKNLAPVAATAQVVNATAETKTGKVKLAFAAKDGALVSTTPLPEGDGYTVVVQVRDSAEAKPKNYRVAFHDETCGGCNRAEYACTCDDHGGGDDAHGHKH